MTPEEKDALRAKTSTRPSDFLSDCKEYDAESRSSNGTERPERLQSTRGELHMKKKQYHGVDGKLCDTPTGDDGQVLTSSVAEDIRNRTGKDKRRG